MEKGIRINKYLSEAGVCSRREADRQVENGNVWIDGEPAMMGSQVLPGQEVLFMGRLVQKEEEKILIAVHKPVGIVCTAEKREKDNIVDFIHYPKRIYPVGRLDKDSEGLLIMTNDGDLIEQMMRGANCHEKEYQVRVDKPVSDNFLKGMSEGVYLEDLDITTRKCKVRRTGRYTFSMILTQGVNRQIRRMTESFGYRVRALRRIRVLNITLEGLKPGEYRVLQREELEKLYRECK